MTGKIFVIGIGPGDISYMSMKAIEAISKSEVIIGYKTYIQLIKSLIINKTIVESGMRKEIQRCNEAIDYANKGNTVAIISSGDPGVYGMAGLLLEIIVDKKIIIETEIIPGITSALASSAKLGAPLMNDFAVISLSDLLTDWKIIKKRLIFATKSDFVICLYNPKSSKRKKAIEKARKVFLKYRNPKTPVGLVKNCNRKNEEVILTNIKNMLKNEIDMTSTLIIGNSFTYIIDNRMITPRGYLI